MQPSQMLPNSLIRDLFKTFLSHRGLLGFDILVLRWRICTGFEGAPQERRIYESTLVGQKVALVTSLKIPTYQALFLIIINFQAL